MFLNRRREHQMFWGIFWAARHEGVLGSGGRAPRILWPRHSMDVSGHLHAPAALLKGKEPLLPIG